MKVISFPVNYTAPARKTAKWMESWFLSKIDKRLSKENRAKRLKEMKEAFNAWQEEEGRPKLPFELDKP